ncbi:hypothetical protein [Streptomyces sp. AD55]|uniref:hypothetical protein n=1 Tax=Streptomyces sp. AD55 TaxID=3242895 RepID=UPI00352808DA
MSGTTDGRPGGGPGPDGPGAHEGYPGSDRRFGHPAPGGRRPGRQIPGPASPRPEDAAETRLVDPYAGPGRGEFPGARTDRWRTGLDSTGGSPMGADGRGGDAGGQDGPPWAGIPRGGPGRHGADRSGPGHGRTAWHGRDRGAASRDSDRGDISPGTPPAHGFPATDAATTAYPGPAASRYAAEPGPSPSYFPDPAAPTAVFPRAGGAPPAFADPAATAAFPDPAAPTTDFPDPSTGFPDPSTGFPARGPAAAAFSDPGAPTTALPGPVPGPATAALRDPWRDPLGAGVPEAEQTHDPHEVTVQLDAVQFGDGVLRQAERSPAKSGPDGSDGPVFVDESGRRSRRFRRLGIALGMACAVYAVVIVSTLLSGNSDAPWLPVPGQEEGQPAGRVDTTPPPAESADPSAGVSEEPLAEPSADDATTTAPGAASTVPGTTGGPSAPGGAADPPPAATGSAGRTAGTEPDGKPSTPQEPPPAGRPSPPTGGESPADPSQPSSGGPSTDPGDGTTANGSADSTPVAAGRATAPVAGPRAPSTSPSLSPENTL